MADKEARIRIGIDNASQTIADLNKIVGAFRNIGASLGGLKKQADDAAGAIVRIRPLNLTKATDEAQAFRDQVTKISFAAGDAGKNVDFLQAKFEQVGERIKVNAPEVSSFVMSLGRMTGDFKGVINAAEDLGRAMNNMGLTMDEMREIGASLYNSIGVPIKDIAGEMEDFGKIAENVGTRGGKVGLLKSLQELGPQIEKFDTSTPEKRRRIAAFVAGMSAQSPHGQGTADAGAMLGWFSGDALGLGRYLGRKSIIHGGKVDDPFDLLQRVKAKAGGTRDPAALVRVLQNYSSLTAGQKASLMTAFSLEDAYLGKAEAATGRKYGLKGVGALDLGEAEKGPAIPGAMILSQPATRIRVLTPEEQARHRLPESVVDTYSTTPAARLKAAEIERENRERQIGRGMLGGRDRYETTKSADEKIQLESTIGGLGNVPLVGGVLESGAHALTAAEFDPRIPNATGGGSRTEQIQQQMLNEQKQTNHLLRQQAGDSNGRDVNRRKGAHQ